MSTQLTEHFSLDEVVVSQIAARYGFDNNIPDFLLPAIRNTAEHMELVRNILGSKPLHIDSWYRCLPLNKILKSADTSQHVKGEAVDFICPAYGTPLEICKRIISQNKLLGFDQLILEHTWVHISFCSNPTAIPRGHVLSLLSSGGYAQGLTNKDGISYE